MSGLFRASWHRSPAVAYAAIAAGVFGHATSEFVSVLTGLAGPEASVWRFGLGGLGLLALAACFPASRDLFTPLRRDGGRICAIALIGVALPYLAFHWSLDFATVPQVATLVTAIPVFVAVIAPLVDRKPVAGVKLLTGAIALCGVGLLVTDGYLAELAGNADNLFGIALVLVCAAGAAAYVVLVRPVVAAWGALRATALTMAIGGAALWLIVGLAWGRWIDPDALFDMPAEGAWAVIALAAFNTTLTQFLWIGGLAALPDVTRGAALFFLKPVIATALAAAFLAAPLSALQIAAAALICSTVLVEPVWSRRRARLSV